MMVILPRVIHRIPIDPRTIFRQTFHWLRDCFPITDTALLNGGVTPTLLVETAGGLERGQWEGMIEIMKQNGGEDMVENMSLKRIK